MVFSKDIIQDNFKYGCLPHSQNKMSGRQGREGERKKFESNSKHVDYLNAKINPNKKKLVNIFPKKHFTQDDQICHCFE